MYCHKCGKELLDDAQYCRYCGTNVEIPDRTKKLMTEEESKEKLTKTLEQAEHLVDNGIVQNFFRIKGRLNRLRYFKRVMLLCILSFVSFTLFEFLCDVFLKPSTDDSSFILINSIFLILVTIICLISHVTLVIRRLHDLDESGWLALVMFIPVLGIIGSIFLLILKGTEGDNKYGKDPLERSLKTTSKNGKVKFGNLILLILLIIALLFSFWYKGFQNRKNYSQSNQNISTKVNEKNQDQGKNSDIGVFMQLGNEDKGLEIFIDDDKLLKTKVFLELNPNKTDVIADGKVITSVATKMEDIIIHIFKTSNIDEFDVIRQDEFKKKIKNEINYQLGAGTVYNVYITSFLINRL